MKNIKMTDRTMKLNLANTYVDDDVTVEIPEGYLKPENTIEITENGIVDVTNYASANVNVAGSGSGTPIEGTAIPIGEKVEKIYFNTNNTKDKTNTYLSQLSYIQTNLLPNPIYPIFASTSDGNEGIFIFAIKVTDDNETFYNITCVTNLTTQAYFDIYTGSVGINSVSNGFPQEALVGMLRGTVSTMEISTNQISLSDFNGLPIGTENEKIKNVLSITSWVEQEKSIVAYKASVTGLGNESPTSQVYTRDDNFPTSFEEVTDDLGNIFIKIPTMYRKVDTVTSSQITKFTMSTAKIDDTYQPYPVFVKPNGEVMPYVLIGKYLSNSSTSVMSIKIEIETEVPVRIAFNNARTYARSLGTGYQLYDWQFQKLFDDLCLLISRKVEFNSGAAYITNYLGIENLTRSCFIDGVSRDNTIWCIAYDPDKYVNSATSSTDGYIAVNYSAPISGLITKLGYDESNPFFNYPNATINNTIFFHSYYCDTYAYSSENCYVTAVVGDRSSEEGLWSCNAHLEWSDADTYVRLCYRPLDESI